MLLSIIFISIISVIAFKYFNLGSATEPKVGPIVFNSTDWSKYGYPILNRPIEYPYMIELFQDPKQYFMSLVPRILM